MHNLQEEFEEIGLGLERWHGIFYELWAVGTPKFTKAIPTAAVAWNKRSLRTEFLFNPDFWKSLSQYEREFVICHEMLHIIYEHLRRMQDCESKDIANIAADIIVNHRLLEDFGFIREDLPIEDILIWIDKVFPDRDDVETNREFEYYYNLIKDEAVSIGGMSSIDQHGAQSDDKDGQSGGRGLGEDYSDIPEDYVERFMEDAINNLSDEEIKSLKRGCEPGTAVHKAIKSYIRLKRKWEDIVQIWTAVGEQDKYSWVNEARRYTLLPDEFMLPALQEQDEKGAKVNLWWFQDTSGSCKSFANHFFNAAGTFPTKKFDVKMFGFDVKVYPIIKGKLKGFGGTAFAPIEEFIQEQMREKGVGYPDAIFVFTDGHGNDVHPKYPERWYWFLEGSYQSKRNIPNESKVFQLSDFVTGGPE
jgi:predicted metal-dependent peptidase